MKPEKRKQMMMEQLIHLKLQLMAAKPIYAQYDELLQQMMNAGALPPTVEYNGVMYSVRLDDKFSDGNTSWKSVGFRRYDLSIGRIAELSGKKKKGKRK